ncbi:TIGR03915 family putative DNA repair protein [Aquimarina sp. W85]|uniref:TIGR03915 family putative DNA repair protein n=1 Tax=Aquimarina rhodophyticola TaxID=3342246 RepID=UPI00366BD060
MTTKLLYDGSFEGLLTCIFVIFEEQISNFSIQKNLEATHELFGTSETVYTDLKKADRVWTGFKKRSTKTQQQKVLKVFLSEIKGLENTLAIYFVELFTKKRNIGNDYSNPTIVKISQVAKMVSREKHRMEAFVRFQQTKDNQYIAYVEPDFNVLPLISSHFKDRYADQQWLIYDSKRMYGIYYDLNEVKLITLDLPSKTEHKIKKNIASDTEFNYQRLWSTYFEKVNISSRKNTKLHTQHIPLRYWKYLTEKTTIL